MPYKYERLYKFPAVIDFALLEADGIEINATASCVIGDVVLMIDEGASANSTNLFSSVAVGQTLVLTSAETAGARIIGMIKDAESEWLTEYFIIETYGDENSQHNRRSPGVLLETIIASVSGNAEFVVTDKPNDNNTLLNSVAMIIDNSSEDSPPDRSFRNVISYTGATGTVVLASSTDYSIAAGDRVVFLPSADIESAGEIADAVWDELRTAHTNAGSFGHGVNINEYTTSGKDATSAIFHSALSDFEVVNADNLPTNFGSLLVDSSGNVTVGANQDKTGYFLASGAYASAAKIALVYNWSALANVSGATTATRSTLNALRFLRNKWSISGSALTVTRENDTDTAWTSDLSVVASANAVIGFDPD